MKRDRTCPTNEHQNRFRQRLRIAREAPVIIKNLLHYRVLEKIGAGGQGAVYKALDEKLGRTVVVKVLPPELTVSEVNLKRFEREARLASSLDHPNICTIFDLNEADDVHFIAMQYVEGRNVRELVKGRPLELRSALLIGIQVCDALAAAHGRGVIHRDIKANNVMVTATGQVKILDFGLAKLSDEQTARSEGIHETHLTEIGVPYGTATYAAPEQAQGLRVDARADIFSTGVLLYEMLTGRWPFHGKTTIDVRYAVLHDTPQPLAEARPEPVPPRLQQILDRAMAKEPRDRYQKITELAEDLRGVLYEISTGDAQAFQEISTSAPPRHLAGSHPLTRSLRRVGTFASLKPMNLVLAGGALLILAATAFWLWRGATSTSSAIVASTDVMLRLHGSNTVGAKLAPALAEEFLKRLGAREVRIVPGSAPEEALVLGILPGESSPKAIEIQSHGSATAFTALLENKGDIGLSSRRIKPEEVQSLAALGDMTSPACEHILALDGIAVIVNGSNPIQSLTREQLGKIFSGEINSWTQVLSSRGRVKVYARDDKSGTYDSFKALMLGNSQLVAAAERFEDSAALSDAVARDPEGIGFVGLPYIRDAKAVAISESEAAPLLPNRLTIATEDYILSRRLYLYSQASPQNKWVRQFIDFTLSDTAQAVVSRSGFIAQDVNAETAATLQDAPDDYRKLTAGAERLSLNFRFHKGGKELDNKALFDLDRVVNFITELNLTGQNILLLGFANDGSNRDSNISLSTERALAVAGQFKRRGVAPAVIKGFGPDLPVASNSTEEGKEKNRRVEIWLRK
ncbi:MAG: protein kinase [Rubrivivax sp.]|nr:protein kinase [Pyrinomonadaceae bacterium]